MMIETLCDLRAKGDADLAAQLPRSSEGRALRHGARFFRAELASYKDAERRASRSLLEETVASQAEEIRRLSEAAAAPAADASAVFGAAPADAAGLFGAPPADADVVDELRSASRSSRPATRPHHLPPASRKVLNYSDVSRPWKKRTQMPQMPWPRPTNACRRSAPRARPTRRRSSTVHATANRGQVAKGPPEAAEADVELFEDDERAV